MSDKVFLNLDTYGLWAITPDDLIGNSIAILGINGSGKSNSAAVLMEEALASGIPIIVIDIAGEYHTLREHYEHVTVIGRALDESLCRVDLTVDIENVCEVARTVYANAVSVVFDMSGIRQVDRFLLLNYFLTAIWELSARMRIPTMIFLEEAHNWIPQQGRTQATDVVIDMACEGRKRGISLVMVGQRSARIDKDTLTQAKVSILHRVNHPLDMKVYIDMTPRPPRYVRETVYKLRDGEAIILYKEKVLRVQMRFRHTRHPGATPTMDMIPTKSKQLSLLDLMETR